MTVETMIIDGVFMRWSVVGIEDGQPIEGCVYTAREKAAKRMRGMADQSKYKVDPVFVMTRDGMAKLIEAMK